MPLIESPRNPRVQAALELRTRAARLVSAATLVDGARECGRAIEAGVEIRTAFVCRALAASVEAMATLGALEATDADIVEVSERVHERLAFGNRRDGIVLVVGIPATGLGSLRPGPNPLVIVTEDVEKPGNLGAILRTADAAGCDAVIAIGGSDLFNPNVIRASVGTVFSLPVAAASAIDTLAWLGDHGIRPIAARVDAPLPYTRASLAGPLAFILGSEADGLSGTWQDSAIDAVRLPMHGVADSLNVSVAAAVLAFEARRQRDVATSASRSTS